MNSLLDNKLQVIYSIKFNEDEDEDGIILTAYQNNKFNPEKCKRFLIKDIHNKNKFTFINY
jgi:hypothetical protein